MGEGILFKCSFPFREPGLSWAFLQGLPGGVKALLQTPHPEQQRFKAVALKLEPSSETSGGTGKTDCQAPNQSLTPQVGVGPENLHF